MTAVVGAARAPEARTPSPPARRARIITAATDLLEDRGYEQIQVREVAEVAEVALATLYRYFPSKEQLYATVLVTWAESFDASKATRRSSDPSDQARLRAALRRAVRAYERHPNFYRLITALEVVADPAVVELFAQFSAGFGATLRDTIHTVSDEDADVIAQLMSALLGALLRSWSMGRSPIARVYSEVDRSVDLIFRVPASNPP